MTCEVNGSASCKNKMIENWAQGSGVFLTIPDPRLGLVLPTTLDARLTWFEGPANVATSESGSVTPPIAERCSPCNRGVSSSGTVGVVMVMGVRSVGEGYKEETGGGGMEKEDGRRETRVCLFLDKIEHMWAVRTLSDSSACRCQSNIQHTTVHN